MQLDPIGVVRSPVRDAVDDAWGDAIAEIHVEEALAPGLEGLDQWSHAVIIFFMHQATFDPATDLRRRPRGLASMPETGIFAQRARHRPNPIGISAVELAGIEGNVLRVRGLDAVDGTPVLDIKPYAPGFDSVPNAVVPEWFERLMEDYF